MSTETGTESNSESGSESVEVHVEVPQSEPVAEPVAETPPVVVVNTDTEPSAPTDGVVGAVIDHAEDIAQLRADNERLAQELEALRAQQAVTAVEASIASETAGVALQVADEAANPHQDAESDAEPERGNKFHRMWFGGNK